MLFEWQKANRDLLNSGSLFKYQQQLGLCQAKARSARPHPGLSCVWQGPKHLSHHLHTSRKQNWKQSRTQTEALGQGTQTSEPLSQMTCPAWFWGIHAVTCTNTSSFVWLSNVPFHKYTIVCVSLHPLMFAG